MCETRSIAIYVKDAGYLDAIKKKLKLNGKAPALELIIKTIKRLKLENELR